MDIFLGREIHVLAYLLTCGAWRVSSRSALGKRIPFSFRTSFMTCPTRVVPCSLDRRVLCLRTAWIRPRFSFPQLVLPSGSEFVCAARQRSSAAAHEREKKYFSYSLDSDFSGFPYSADPVQSLLPYSLGPHS